MRRAGQDISRVEVGSRARARPTIPDQPQQMSALLCFARCADRQISVNAVKYRKLKETYFRRESVVPRAPPSPLVGYDGPTAALEHFQPDRKGTPVIARSACDEASPCTGGDCFVASASRNDKGGGDDRWAGDSSQGENALAGLMLAREGCMRFAVRMKTR